MILIEMLRSEDSWPFLVPVNVKEVCIYIYRVRVGSLLRNAVNANNVTQIAEKILIVLYNPAH